jgi:hypothetical protein
VVKYLDAVGVNSEPKFIPRQENFKRSKMYIDPNTGGMLFQVLAAFLAVFSGIALLLSGKIRAYFARFRRSMRGDSLENDTETPEAQPSSPDSTQDIDSNV